jgi:hypothetical protein
VSVLLKRRRLSIEGLAEQHGYVDLWRVDELLCARLVGLDNNPRLTGWVYRDGTSRGVSGNSFVVAYPSSSRVACNGVGARGGF